MANPLAERVGMTFGHEPARRDLPGGEAATAPPSAAAPDPPALAASRVRPAAAEPHFLDQLGRDLAHDREGRGRLLAGLIELPIIVPCWACPTR